MSVEVTRLPSGLAVVTDSMPHLESASLGVWVGSGGRDERPDEHGISHLLEHMAFKGTARRSAREIAEEIEAVGGDLKERDLDSRGLLHGPPDASVHLTRHAAQQRRHRVLLARTGLAV